MDFYSAVSNRRTAREWQNREVSAEIIKRILDAGLKAPSNDHLRQWEFVVLRTDEEKINALACIAKPDPWQEINIDPAIATSPMRGMFAYAVPRQYEMLSTAPYVILPFFRQGPGLFRATSLSALNSFASIWCVIENMFLAASAEGLACAMHIPVGNESIEVANAVGAPDGYVMPCFIGIGYPTAETLTVQQHCYTAEQKTHFGKW